uniref:Ig-like domain-containing protein n=1 Tax=Anopheles stephensi TaxID=30069 RepID=A0A182YJ62_ANOST
MRTAKTSLLYSNEAKAAHRNSLGPLQSQFITKNNTRVISQRGGLAVLPCSVTMTTPATVSWFRRKDYQLLTVGLSTYSSDDRFLVEHTRHLGNWALRIKNARKEDEGLYECQISTHPPQSIFIELRIVEAVAEILEAPDLHIDEGSTLRLECKLKRATESPLYVFWYHEDRMVNYDQEDGVSVSNNKLTSSILTVRNATARHGGNYTCAPANARQSSVYVHVLKGKWKYFAFPGLGKCFLFCSVGFCIRKTGVCIGHRSCFGTSVQKAGRARSTAECNIQWKTGIDRTDQMHALLQFHNAVFVVVEVERRGAGNSCFNALVD